MNESDQPFLDLAEHERAQARRDRLREVMDRLERALAQPAGPDVAEWRHGVAEVMGDLEAVFDDHVTETEATGGLFDDIMEHAPRLAHRASRLRGEHPELTESVAALRATLEAEITDGYVSAVRREATTLLGQLIRHRQDGADLLFEAYWVDVSTGD